MWQWQCSELVSLEKVDLNGFITTGRIYANWHDSKLMRKGKDSKPSGRFPSFIFSLVILL